MIKQKNAFILKTCIFSLDLYLEYYKHSPFPYNSDSTPVQLMEMHPFPVFSGVESVERTVRGQTRGVKTIDQRSEPITIENTRKRAFGLRRGKWKQSQSAGKGAMLTCPPPPPSPT